MKAGPQIETWQRRSAAGTSLWTTQYGQGRVFVDALGHDFSAVTEQVFKVTFTRGVEWAATGNVTLKVPPELAAK